MVMRHNKSRIEFARNPIRRPSLPLSMSDEYIDLRRIRSLRSNDEYIDLRAIHRKRRPQRYDGGESDVSYTIYSLEGCSACVKTKELFKSKSIRYKEIPVNDKNLNSVYAEIDSKTNGYRYFPIIFKDGKFIGGYADLKL